MEIRLRNIISAVAPALLGDKWGKYGDNTNKKAARFIFECSFYIKKNFNGNRFFLTVIVTQSYEVFWSTGGHLLVCAQKDNFNFYSDHDQCWRQLSFLDQIYFDECQKVDPKLAPIKVNKHIDFAILDNPISVINVEVTRKANCEDYSYRKDLRIL